MRAASPPRPPSSQRLAVQPSGHEHLSAFQLPMYFRPMAREDRRQPPSWARPIVSIIRQPPASSLSKALLGSAKSWIVPVRAPCNELPSGSDEFPSAISFRASVNVRSSLARWPQLIRPQNRRPTDAPRQAARCVRSRITNSPPPSSPPPPRIHGPPPLFMLQTPNTFITSSPKWLITFTAMRPARGRGNGREVSR